MDTVGDGAATIQQLQQQLAAVEQDWIDMDTRMGVLLRLPLPIPDEVVGQISYQRFAHYLMATGWRPNGQTFESLVYYERGDGSGAVVSVATRPELGEYYRIKAGATLTALAAFEQRQPLAVFLDITCGIG